MAEGDSTDDVVPVRVCSDCEQVKPATRDYFHAYKRAPDGCRSVCRICRSADHAANRDERLQKRRQHYQANKPRLLDAVKAYYRRNAEAQRAAALERHYRDREQRLLQMRAYRAKNLDALNQRRRPKSRELFRARYGIDLEFTLKHRVRSLIRVTLKNGREGMRMRELLGYTARELMAHLERQFTRGMSWQKFMAGEIHIDHIVPAAAFECVAGGLQEFRACWALSNLRPMWASENLAKSDKVLTLL